CGPWAMARGPTTPTARLSSEDVHRHLPAEHHSGRSQQLHIEIGRDLDFRVSAHHVDAEDARLHEAALHGCGGDCAGAGAGRERLACAALPDPRLEPVRSCDARELDVRAFRKARVRAESRSALLEIVARELVDEHDAVPVREGDRVDPRAQAIAEIECIVQCLAGIRCEVDVATVERRASHLHADHQLPAIEALLDAHAHSVADQPHREPLTQLHDAATEQPRAEDAQPVAALLRLGAVRVPDSECDAVGQVGDENAVGADAAVTVADATDALGRELDRKLGRIDHDVVVAEPFTFGEAEQVSHRGCVGSWDAGCKGRGPWAVGRGHAHPLRRPDGPYGPYGPRPASYPPAVPGATAARSAWAGGTNPNSESSTT